MNRPQLDDLGRRAAAALHERAVVRPRPAFRPVTAGQRLRAVALPGAVGVAAASVALVAMAVAGLTGDGPPVRIDPVPDAPEVAERPEDSDRPEETDAAPDRSCDRKLEHQRLDDGWRVDLRFGRLAEAPVFADRVYLGTGPEASAQSQAGCVVALEPRTGMPLWTRDLRLVPMAGMAPVGDLLYVANTRTLMALDAASGAERWRLGERADQIVVATADELLVRVRSGDGSALVSLEPGSGDERWRAESDRLAADVLVDDAYVGLRTRDGVDILDRATGDVVHHAVEPGPHDFVVALAQDTLVTLRPQNNLGAVDVVANARLYERNIPGSRNTQHVVTPDGRIVFAADDANAYAVDLRSGRILWSAGIGSWPTSDAITTDAGAGGRSLYVGTNRGLSAVDTDDGTTRWDLEVGRARTPVQLDADHVLGVFGDELLRIDRETGEVERLRRLSENTRRIDVTEDRIHAQVGVTRLLSFER